MAAVKEPAPRTYGGESGDERVARRRDALILAAFDLVAEQGWRDLRIEHVCRAAGLNKRYFYESFKDLDALTGALMEWLTADVIEVTLAAMELDAPPDELVHAGISALVHHATDDPRRARILFGETPAGEAAMRHRTAAIRRLAAVAAARGRAIHDVEDERLMELSAGLLVGGTSQAVLDWIDGRLPVTREAFIDDLAALWLMVGDGVEELTRVRRDPR
jgi:AcrR family transcriptional regulator